MKKPFVICHLIASLDGRISGDSFYLDETTKAMDAHWEIRADYDCDAVLNGAVTAAEIYADGFVNDQLAAVKRSSVSREDFFAETDLDHYVVCLDPEGLLKWSRNYVDRPVQPKSHVVEVLLETVSDEYLDMLRELDISYLFAGRDELDIPLLMEKLVTNLGIERILVTGGGMTDWTMLEAGVVDEISVIITPTISGNRESATLFDGPESAGGFPLELIEVRELQGGSLLLRYRTKQEQEIKKE